MITGGPKSTGKLKFKMDRIWDTMWSGGISNPLPVIEQLTCLRFIKRLDERQTLREHKAARTKKPIAEPVFAPEQDHRRAGARLGLGRD